MGWHTDERFCPTCGMDTSHFRETIPLKWAVLPMVVVMAVLGVVSSRGTVLFGAGLIALLIIGATWIGNRSTRWACMPCWSKITVYDRIS